VNLVVEDGEFAVLLGPSGSGKTTLLKMVNRLIEPTAGRVRIGGVVAADLPVHALRRRIGYVIQHVGLFPHMTVAANIAVVPKLLGWSRERIATRVDEMLELVALEPDSYRDRRPAQLSGGQQQRVGVARALAGDPEVLLMDEPFGAIDALSRFRLQGELLRLRMAVRKTILFVTHDVDEALRLADRVVVLREGAIVQAAAPMDLLRSPRDDFVRALVGADDIVRQLGQLTVARAMRKLARPGGPAVDIEPARGVASKEPIIEATASLHDGLSILLTTGANEIRVVDKGVPVGFLSLDDIRASARVL
jgi:osmoprotectant transport system ATP-binding protein